MLFSVPDLSMYRTRKESSGLGSGERGAFADIYSKKSHSTRERRGARGPESRPSPQLPFSAGMNCGTVQYMYHVHT